MQSIKRPCALDDDGGASEATAAPGQTTAITLHGADAHEQR